MCLLPGPSPLRSPEVSSGGDLLICVAHGGSQGRFCLQEVGGTGVRAMGCATCRTGARFIARQPGRGRRRGARTRTYKRSGSTGADARTRRTSARTVIRAALAARRRCRRGTGSRALAATPTVRPPSRPGALTVGATRGPSRDPTCAGWCGPPVRTPWPAKAHGRGQGAKGAAPPPPRRPASLKMGITATPARTWA